MNLTRESAIRQSLALLFFVGFSLIVPLSAIAGIGEAAIVALKFPFGARSTGLGETFTGIANSVDATYYNPAGLGQEPLANTWNAYTPGTNRCYTAICGKTNQKLDSRERVWVGTVGEGLLQFDGRLWLSHELYIIAEDDNLVSIAGKFLPGADNFTLARAVRIIKDANNIETNQYKYLRKILSPYVLKGKVNEDVSIDSSTLAMDEIINLILGLEKKSQTEVAVYGIVSNRVDSTAADTIASQVVKVFAIEDKHFNDLLELRIPYSIAIRDTVTALALDESDRLWVGTTNGLYRYNGTAWNRFSMDDGLPASRITSLAIGPGQKIAVGTNQGIGILQAGSWAKISLQEGLADSAITCIVYSPDDVLYAGGSKGLMVLDKGTWTLTDTAQGLISNQITALYYDSRNQLWVGGKNGLSILSEESVRRYQFPGSTICGFTEEKNGSIWIATNNGAIQYTIPTRKFGIFGNIANPTPVWRPFHSKNVLKGDTVSGISVSGKDVWIITDQAVNQLSRGDREVTAFYEPLLPTVRDPGLWHSAVAGTIPTEDWGTIGLYMNYLNYGKNVIKDNNDIEERTVNSYEYVASLCYGMEIVKELSTGINIKFIYSSLAPTSDGQGVARSFAVDVAFLKRNLFLKNLSLGFMIMNMGPAVWYINKDDADPIPFTLQLGTSYTLVQNQIHSLLIAADFEREIAKHAPDGKAYPFWDAVYYDLINDPNERIWDELDQITEHFGVEYWYAYTIALRTGYLYDIAGKRGELDLGISFRYSAMNIDWSYIYSPETSQIRNGQWRFSFTFAK